jgi:hypothetical protein
MKTTIQNEIISIMEKLSEKSLKILLSFAKGLYKSRQ